MTDDWTEWLPAIWICWEELKPLFVRRLSRFQGVLKLYEEGLWKYSSLSINIVLNVLITPRSWAHCARPEPTQHISHSLIPHCFSSSFIPYTADVHFSSPALILPRAEHSSPCSNTASGVPLLVEILPFSFAFSLCFNFHSKCVCSAPTSGMQSHFFFQIPRRRKWCIVRCCCCPRHSRTAELFCEEIDRSSVLK